MPFVERGPDGRVKGVYRQLQAGYAEEELADDHPDVVSYLNQQAQINAGNAIESARRSRAQRIEEIERRMSLGAPQGEVNAAMLDLLKE